MEFEVLGPVRVQGVEPAGRLQRVLLGMLLAHANEPVRPDVLTDALWDGEPEPRAAQRLQFHVHKLRRALAEPDRLTLGSAGYLLRVAPGELDADRFTSAVARAADLLADDPAECARLVRGALALWRGTPYQGLDTPRLVEAADHLVERRLAALELCHQADLAAGRHAEIVPELAELVRAHPLRERLHWLLISALHRSGRQGDALAAYRTARQVIVDELGIEPGAELRELEQHILAGEPVAAPEPSRAMPAQLPHNVRGFVGRAAEVSELDSLLADADARLAVVAGTAGVGKTALAVRWAHRVRDRFPDGQLYVDLRGYGPEEPLSAHDVLAGFLRALGMSGAAVPVDPDERASTFRTLMDGRRMLLVLDNARTVEQVRPLLPGSPSCLVLVTSRDALAGLVAREGAHRIDLDRLTVPEAGALMRELTGDETDAVAALVDLCARLPLALRIAAELVRSRRGVSVAQLVDELADEQRRLDLLDAHGDRHTAVRAVFSWSYHQLPDRAAGLFRMFGVHPGHATEPFALAALSDLDIRETRQALDVLVRAHLVEETAPGRYQPHDLLRAYATELAESIEDKQARDAALARLLDFYLDAAAQATEFVAYDVDFRPAVPPVLGPRPTFADYEDAVRWLDAERANLVAVAFPAAAAGSTYPTAMSDILLRYLNTGYHDEALVLHGLALAAAQRHGDRAAEARALRTLGNTNRLAGNTTLADEQVRQALALAVELGDVDMQASAHSNLAGSCADTGRFRDAIEHARKAIELRDAVNRPGHTVIDRTNLGYVLRLVGEYQAADEVLQQAVSLARNRHVRAYALLRRAELLADLERFDESLDLLDQVHGHDGGDQTGGGDILAARAQVQHRLGNTDLAAEQFAAALSLGRAVREPSLIARSLNGLGEIARTTGDTAAALRAHEEALDVATDSADWLEQGRAHDGLGDTHAALGDHGRAAEHWRQALSIFDKLGVPAAAEARAKLS